MSSVSSPSPANVEDEDDWEETLIYVDLDDIPSVEELFAVEPDDFLLSQSKKDREVEEHKSKKLLRPSLTLKFFNLDDKNPVLQIGDRFYMGKYEEPFGTNLFFRQKPKSTESDPGLQNDADAPPKTVLTPLTAEMRPPPHPVFGPHINCVNEYELVAKVHKVLKMTRRNVLHHDESGHASASASNLDSVGVGANPSPSTSSSSENFTPLRTVDLKVGTPRSSEARRRNNAFLRGKTTNTEGEDESDDDIQTRTMIVTKTGLGE